MCDYEKNFYLKKVKAWAYSRAGLQFKTKLIKESIKRKEWEKKFKHRDRDQHKDIKNKKIYMFILKNVKYKLFVENLVSFQ